jgi:ammonia channel protein AmtB
LGSGLIDGNPGQLVTQALAVLTAVALSGAGTAILIYAIKAVIGLRPSNKDEETGLDLADHGEAAYHGGEYGATTGAGPIGSSVTLSVPVNVKAIAGD